MTKLWLTTLLLKLLKNNPFGLKYKSLPLIRWQALLMKQQPLKLLHKSYFTYELCALDNRVEAIGFNIIKDQIHKG